MRKPILIIHGGITSLIPNRKQALALNASMKKILAEAYSLLKSGASSEQAVVKAIELLENDPLYNAGYGSKLQRDGKIRMSAGIMDGESLKFSGIVNAQNIKNPIKLAQKLQKERDRVLDPDGAKLYAKENKITFASPYTKSKKIEFEKKLRGKTGTVGAVALDIHGKIVAGTSTGGKGFEVVGRVSDTPTIAGTYANSYAGISATGVGEQIVSHALAAAIATRVADGLPLEKAIKRSLQNAKKEKAIMGCICLDQHGNYAIGKTTPFMAWGMASDQDFFVSADEFLDASVRDSAKCLTTLRGSK